jgi:hypothetical protein
MATTYKVLGQINPASNTLTNVYVVPSYYNAVISTVAICNQTSANTRFSLSVQPRGNTILTQHYLVYNANLPANDTIPYTIGITLGPGDVLSANTYSSAVSITAFGMQADSIYP